MSAAAKAFIKAQSEMGKAIKNAKNPHLKSMYADLGSVLDAALPALHENGIGLMQPSGMDEHGPFVDTILMHESGERFTGRTYLIMGKQDMQGLGSAITYARRYGLLGMAGLAPEDDDGEATKAPPRQQRQPEPTAAPAADVRATADRIIKKLHQQGTVADLTAAWTGEKEARRAVFDAAPDLHETEIKGAFAARKAALEEVPF